MSGRRKNCQGLWNRINDFLLTLGLIVFVYATGIIATITISPKNTVALKGHQVILPCSTNLSHTLEWKVKNISNPTLTTIYDGYKINPDFDQYYNISRSLSGQFDIIVKNPDRAIATLYQCIESGDDVQTIRSVELIVLETQPGCGIQDLNFSDIAMFCQVTYSGNWAPVMEWTSNRNNYTHLAKREIIRKGVVLSTLTIPINSITNGHNFICTTKFTSDAYTGAATERNIPNYVHECIITPIKIIEPMCSISAILEDADKKNMVFRCEANYSGSLTPFIKWIGNSEISAHDAQTELITNTSITSTLTLPLEDARDGQKFACLAMFKGCRDECIHECIVMVPSGVNEISREFLKQKACTASVVLAVVLTLILTSVIFLPIGIYMYRTGHIEFH